MSLRISQKITLITLALIAIAAAPSVLGTSTYMSDNIGSTTNTGFTFVTNNTQKMVLDANGNLGIGIASP